MYANDLVNIYPSPNELGNYKYSADDRERYREQEEYGKKKYMYIYRSTLRAFLYPNVSRNKIYISIRVYTGTAKFIQAWKESETWTVFTQMQGEAKANHLTQLSLNFIEMQCLPCHLTVDQDH